MRNERVKMKGDGSCLKNSNITSGGKTLEIEETDSRLTNKVIKM